MWCPQPYIGTILALHNHPNTKFIYQQMPPQETDKNGILKKKMESFNDSVDDKEDNHFVLALENELKH